MPERARPSATQRLSKRVEIGAALAATLPILFRSLRLLLDVDRIGQDTAVSSPFRCRSPPS